MRTFTTFIGLIICQLSFGQIPSLSVQNSEKKQDLEISQLKVSVNVVGNIATTTFDIVFYNPLAQNMEGELSMPLSDGQEICRYALEINGKLREGVIVEKIKARQTFEAIVRQNIDPGIATMTKGNFFKTKIFPIPANGSKRVVLALSETLRGDDKNLYYSLPIETSNAIGEFKLDVKVVKNQSEEKEIHSDFENIKFDDRDDVYSLNLERKNFRSTTPLNFTIPKFSKTDHQLYTCDLDGETYFYLVIKAPKLSSVVKEVPEKITIYWDISFSASKRNIEKELRFLNNYLVSQKGDKEVSLITFNQKQNSPVKFNIKHDATQLIETIKQLNNDGATRLDKINFDKNCNEILLFSDAINTIGEDQIKTSNVPIYSISSSTGSNYSFLKRVAAATHGEFIDLNFTSLEKALEIMQKKEEKFLSCNYNQSELKEIFPNTPTRVNGDFEIAGILKGKKGMLEVNYGYSGAITKTQSFEISRGSNVPVSRIWAGKKIEALEMDYTKNQNEIYQLGSKFNIVTPNTAFIVLDRVEDYLRHHITPPDELKEEYNKLLANNVKEPELSTQGIQERNIERIEKLKSWYLNPPKTASKGNRETAERDDVFYVEDAEYDMAPITRQEELPPPPPPGIISEITVVDDDVEMDLEFESSEMDDIPPGKSSTKSSIKVLSWLPDAPYMEVLRHAANSEIDSLYFALKEENINRPSFYIQVADFLFKKKRNDMAIQVLSNTLELDLENPELLKVVARRLVNEGELETAIEIYEEIKKLRPEEPQSYRDLALAYIENKQFQNALDNFQYILDNNWDRFESIKDVVLNELNNLVLMHKEVLDIHSINPKYLTQMPLDIRITLEWSSNDNDIDLWVIDPNGEKCIYNHPQTKIGGKLSTDFTRGYGPEEFSLKDAKRGTYTVYVNYFSESRQTITGPVTVYATLYSNYGTKQQEAKHITVQITDKKETRQIGQLEFEKN